MFGDQDMSKIVARCSAEDFNDGVVQMIRGTERSFTMHDNTQPFIVYWIAETTSAIQSNPLMLDKPATIFVSKDTM